MSTFLQLCQKVAQESGTISGTQPASVVGQVGRLKKVVDWTAEAWVDIQNLHDAWRWMQKTYSSTLTSSTSTYTPASFGISDLREWKRDNLVSGYQPHTIYLTATGVSDENTLREMSYQDWRSFYDRGSQTNNRPTQYAITPAGEIAFGAIPDDTYTVRGEYSQSAVRMTANADIPGLPDAFHQIIVHKALMLLDEHDEAVFNVATATRNYAKYLTDLEKSQLPTIVIGGGPLA